MKVRTEPMTSWQGRIQEEIDPAFWGIFFFTIPRYVTISLQNLGQLSHQQYIIILNLALSLNTSITFENSQYIFYSPSLDNKLQSNQ